MGILMGQLAKYPLKIKLFPKNQAILPIFRCFFVYCNYFAKIGVATFALILLNATPRTRTNLLFPQT